MNDFSDVVAAGKALLDSYDPEWADKVDWDNLNMSSTVDCVLGQLFGDGGVGYDAGLKALSIESSPTGCECCTGSYLDGVPYGFCAEEKDEDGYTDWEGLGEAWKAAVGYVRDVAFGPVSQ